MCFHHKLFRKADELFLSSHDKKRNKANFSIYKWQAENNLYDQMFAVLLFVFNLSNLHSFCSKVIVTRHCLSSVICKPLLYKTIQICTLWFHTISHQLSRKAEIWTIPCTELNLGQWDANWIDLIAFTWLDGDIFCWEISWYFVVIDWQSNSPALHLKWSWTLSSPVKILWCAKVPNYPSLIAVGPLVNKSRSTASGQLPAHAHWSQTDEHLKTNTYGRTLPSLLSFLFAVDNYWMSLLVEKKKTWSENYFFASENYFFARWIVVNVRLWH